MNDGRLLSLVVEKPAAGGRMLARHEGQVVLVSGATGGIPYLFGGSLKVSPPPGE